MGGLPEGMTELLIIFIRIIFHNILYIYQIQWKFSFICCLSVPNRAWIDCFVTILLKSVQNK